jgi:hypothetical protein
VITHKELRVLYQHGEPHAIRDISGCLLFFPMIQRYEGQEPRYQQEIQAKQELADFLMKAIEGGEG